MQQPMQPQQMPLGGIEQAAPENMMPPETMADGGEVEPPRSLEFEALKAQFIAQGMQEVKILSQQLAGAGQEQKPDPLIGLKQQELAIKQQQVQGNLAQDQQELQFDYERLNQRSAELQERIASNERQTAARIQAAQEREMMKQRGK